MYQASFFDEVKKMWMIKSFKSLTSLLLKALYDGHKLIWVMNGPHRYLCEYDPKNGWRVDQKDSIPKA